MAGIGFPLLKLYERANLSGRVQAVGHAMFIAAGPSVLTIICFTMIHMLTGGRATDALVGFRVAVVYAFAIAFIVAAPISLVAVRLVADAFSGRDFSLMRGVYVLATAFGALIAGVAALAVFGWRSGWDMDFVVPAALLSALVTCLFVGISFATAVREYRTVTLAFGSGTLLSAALIIWGIWENLDESTLLLAFHAGLLLAWAGISFPLFATFPEGQRGIRDLALALLRAVQRHRILALGGFLGAFAIWIDKILLWPAGVETINGLMHRPHYDSSVFVGYVLIVPAISVFMVLSETELFRGFRQYQHVIESRGRLGEIDGALGEARDHVTRLIFRMSMIQLFVCVIAAMAAPVLIAQFNLAFGQISTLRLLVLAGAFQFTFLASATVILFIGDVRRYAQLQALFCGLNIVLTVGLSWLRPDLLGLGYFLACAISAVLAYSWQRRSADDLNADVLARA
ncbi:MAG: exopolysaccharide Pel transporter PelG [Devosia sp.]